MLSSNEDVTVAKLPLTLELWLHLQQEIGSNTIKLLVQQTEQGIITIAVPFSSDLPELSFTQAPALDLALSQVRAQLLATIMDQKTGSTSFQLQPGLLSRYSVGHQRFYYDSAKCEQLLIPGNIYLNVNQPLSSTPELNSEAEDIKKFFYKLINLLHDKLNTPKAVARFIAEIAKQQNLIISYQESPTNSQDNLIKSGQSLVPQASRWSVISLTDVRSGSALDVTKESSISPLRAVMGKIIFSFLFALGALLGLAMMSVGILLLLNPQLMPLTFAALPIVAKIAELTSATVITVLSTGMSAWLGYQAHQVRKNIGTNYKPQFDTSKTQNSYALLLSVKNDAQLNLPSTDSALTTDSNFCSWLRDAALPSRCCKQLPLSSPMISRP